MLLARDFDYRRRKAKQPLCLMMFPPGPALPPGSGRPESKGNLHEPQVRHFLRICLPLAGEMR